MIYLLNDPVLILLWLEVTTIVFGIFLIWYMIAKTQTIATKRLTLLVELAKLFRNDVPLNKLFPKVINHIATEVKSIKAGSVVVFKKDAGIKIQSCALITEDEFLSIPIPQHVYDSVKEKKHYVAALLADNPLGYKHVVVCPLRVQGAVVGAFVLFQTKKKISKQELQFVEMLTYQISLEFEDRLLQTKLDAFSKGLSMVEYSYEKIVDNLPVGVVVLDLNARILLWNKSMTNISDIDGNTTIGLAFSDIMPKEKSLKTFIDDLYATNMLTSLSGFVFTYRNKKKILEVTGYPLFDMQNNVIAYVIMHWDVTAERQLEQKLKETQAKAHRELEDKVALATKELLDANKELVRLNKVKSEFVSVISHELKTPLTSIKGYIALLLAEKMGGVSEKQKQALSVVNEQSDRLANLINDILDLSKLESGKTTLSIKQTDIAQVMDDVIAVMQPQAQEKSITIHQEYGSSKTVEADKMKIYQVFLNILANAVKFTPKNGTISITLSFTQNRYDVIISDTGIGMTQDQIAHIFEPFFQVQDHMTRNVQGTGLGLTIVKHIVELHRGSINVESAVGQGTTLHLTFPTTLQQ